jgi:hypothetical protein
MYQAATVYRGVVCQELACAAGIISLTSLPECWDTLRAGTNEGYFDFQQIAFFAHVGSGYEPVSAMYQGYP